MSTAQDPPVRKKQKIRRTKKLAAWRAKKDAEVAPTDTKSTKGTTPVAKTEAKAGTKAEKSEKTKK